MLKAAALFYALVVSLIIAVICSSLILFSYFSVQEFQLLDIRNQLKRNVESGLVYLQNNTSLNTNEDKEIDLGAEAIGKLIVIKKQWGVYQVFESTAIHQNQLVSKFALVGNLNDLNKSAAVILNESDKPIAVAGNCKFVGNCYLPKSGYKKDKLNGVNFLSEKLVFGETFSNDKFPISIDTDQLAQLESLVEKGSFFANDSLIDLETPFVLDTINNSFHDKTIVFNSNNLIDLSNCNLSGNVIINSKKEIVVAENSNLQEVILIAPKIKFLHGSRVCAQSFASDSIFLEDNVSLVYPSSLAVFGSLNSTKGSCIKLSENDTVIGAVYGLMSKSKLLNGVGILIPSRAVVIGEVYTDGYLDIQGKILGTAYTNKFLINSGSAVHENFLLDGEINAINFPFHFVGSSIFKGKNKIGIIKWLN